MMLNCLAWLGIGGGALAQNRPAGRLAWAADTVAVGGHIALTLEIAHPAGTAAVLPNPATDFGHWMVLGQAEAETERHGAGLRTVVTYQVATFEVAAQQGIRLPFRVVGPSDTLLLETDSATLRLNSRVPQLSPGLAYIPQADAAEVRLPFNWRLLGLGLLLAMGAGVVGWLLLRRPVRRWWLRRMLQRQFDVLLLEINQLSTPDAKQLVNELNLRWKAYMEQAWQTPIRSRTLRELAGLVLLVEQEAPAGLGLRDVLVPLVKLEYAANYAQQSISAAQVAELRARLRPILDYGLRLQLARIA